MSFQRPIFWQGSPYYHDGCDAVYATQEVYDWIRSQPPGRVMTVKGIDQALVPVGAPNRVDVTILKTSDSANPSTIMDAIAPWAMPPVPPKTKLSPPPSTPCRTLWVTESMAPSP